jgi:hypothetical protein
MTSSRDEERERRESREGPSHEEDEEHREERERRSEDLQEAWRRNHPSGYSEAGGKDRPEKRSPRGYPD